MKCWKISAKLIETPALMLILPKVTDTDQMSEVTIDKTNSCVFALSMEVTVKFPSSEFPKL